MRFVRTQTALQTYARIFVQHRAAGAEEVLEDDEEGGERTPPPHDASKRHLAYAIGMIAGAFPDAAKARAQLEKLRWAVSFQQLGRYSPFGRKNAIEASS